MCARGSLVWEGWFSSASAYSALLRFFQLFFLGLAVRERIKRSRADRVFLGFALAFAFRALFGFARPEFFFFLFGIVGLPFVASELSGRPGPAWVAAP